MKNLNEFWLAFLTFSIIWILAFVFGGCGTHSQRKEVTGCKVSGTAIICDGETIEITELIPEPIEGPKGDTGPQGPKGDDGLQGVAGDPGLIVALLDPCGDGAGQDEIIFILNDGRFCVWYKDVGLVVLTDGNYQTTDSQKCKFNVTGTVLTEI